MKCCRQAINKEKITINFRLEYKKCKEKLCANNTVVSIQNHIDFFISVALIKFMFHLLEVLEFKKKLI